MENILKHYNDKIKGVFSFFDRMILTGHLRPFFHAMLFFLSEQNVLLKDYGSYALGITSVVFQQDILLTEEKKHSMEKSS